MDDLPETSSQFRGLLRAQINEQIDKKTDQIFQERAFGLRRPHNFAIPLAFFLQKKCQKWTFRLRRPHNFADRHGRRIDRYVPKRTFGLRRPHNFVFKGVQRWKIVWFLFWRKTGVWLETSSQFRVLSGVFSCNTKKTKKQKLPFGLRRPHNFAAGCAIKFLKKI